MRLATLCCVLVLLSASVTGCGDSLANERQAIVGTWRFELATSVAEARAIYAKDSRTKEVAESRAKKLDNAAASNLSPFAVRFAPDGIGSFRYLMKDEPTLHAEWTLTSDSVIHLNINRSHENVSAPTVLTLHLRPDKRVWMLTPDAIGLPLKRVLEAQ